MVSYRKQMGVCGQVNGSRKVRRCGKVVSYRQQMGSVGKWMGSESVQVRASFTIQNESYDKEAYKLCITN